jgi:hypothetical protein
MVEEETREQIEEIINNNAVEPIACVSGAPQEVKQEEVKEEVKEEIKPKAKPRASRAKPKVKITKEPVEPVVEEPVVEETKIEEKPKKIDKLKEIVKCPDCNMDMTVHTLKYIHKRRGFCKAVARDSCASQATEPEPAPKQKITQDIVNEYIKENPDVVSNYLRNERAMKAQRKQLNARSLLNNAF